MIVPIRFIMENKSGNGYDAFGSVNNQPFTVVQVLIPSPLFL